MNRIFCSVIAAVIAASAVPVLACSPLPPQFYVKTEKRVRDRLDSVDSVVVVTLLEVKKVKKIEMEIELEGERSTFRIDRVFKGRAKPGQMLVLNTYSTCANYVLEKWAGSKSPIISSRRWLLFRNQSETQMPAHDMAQPINFAAYDLRVLPDLVRARANKPR